MELDDFKVRDVASYPEIENSKDCQRTVDVIRELAFSSEGELTAILNYVYQSTVTNKIKDDVAKVLEEIAVVEMTHLDMLMLAICDFGGNPKYKDAMGVPFNANCIKYQGKLKDMLQANIIAETEAIENYKKGIKLVENESLKKLFARIILDEECHLKIFNFLLGSVEFLSC